MMPRAYRLLPVLVILGLLAAPRAASAGIGVGLFVGEPTGLDLKIDLARRSALDIVLGVTSFEDGRGDYAHLTYLVTLGAAHGSSVTVPFRLGIGAAFYDDGGDFGDDINLAVRAPFEVGFAFHNAPIEIYGEIAIKVTFLDENDNRDDVDADGGIGFRVYF